MQVYGNAFHASTYNDRWNKELVSDERETRAPLYFMYVYRITLTDRLAEPKLLCRIAEKQISPAPLLL
jgi:hypothetical protein